MPKKMKKVKVKSPTVKKTTPQRHSSTYDRQYQKLRNVLIKTYPLCQHRGENCTGFTEESHHLQYPATALSHLQAVCHACHVELERNK